MTEGEQAGNDKTAVRPFHMNVPKAGLADLRSRVNAAKWPGRETVTDDSQGVPLATMQELARYAGFMATRPQTPYGQPQLFSEEVRAGFRPLRK